MRRRPSLLFASGEPSALAAVGGAGARTLAELLDDAAKISRALPPLEQDGEALLFCEDRYLFAAGLLGAWMAGFPVALPPNAQVETLRLLAARPTTQLFLHDGAGRDGLELRALRAGASRAAGAPGSSLSLPAAAPLSLPLERHLVTVYTSGSTGPHQRCPKSAAQLLGEAALQAQEFALRSTDRVLATVPAHHIYGLLFGVLVPLSAGAAFVRSTPLHADALAATLRDSGATVLVSVPAHLRALPLLELEELRAPRLIFSSGGALEPSTAGQLARLPAEAFEIFGSSETGGIASRRVARETSWRPLPGVRVEAGEGGQLLLDSPFLEPGLPRPHPCADRIEPLADGTFRLLGRLDDVVKIGGKRVALSEVEARLREQPGVLDAAVLAVPSPSRGAQLRAVAAGTNLDAAALREALLRHFDSTVVPRQIHLAAQLPRMENGKLSAARLLELFGERGGVLATPAIRETVAQPPGDFAPNAPGEIATYPLGAEGDTLRFEVPIASDLPWFRGHFDGLPVLAGVVQLERIVAAQIRRSFPDLGAARRLTRVKFRKPIRPGETLLLELRRSGESVAYSLSRGGELCSSGVFELARGQR